MENNTPTVPDIVKLILKNNPGPLQANWHRFYDSLDIPEAYKADIDRQYKCGVMGSYELFQKILTIWVNEANTGNKVQDLANILKNEEFIYTADVLLTAFNPNQKISESLHSQKKFSNMGNFKRSRNLNQMPIHKLRINNFSRPTELFTGRFGPITQLLSLYQDNVSCNLEERRFLVAVISGLGGIGKTELAKTFGNKFYVEYAQNHSSCIWLAGDTGESFQNSIVEVAENVNIRTQDEDGRPASVEEMFTGLVNTVMDPSSLLIVIDNLDRANEVVNRVLVLIKGWHVTKAPYIVITSRNVNILTSFNYNLVRLDVLNDSEAITFVKKALILEENEFGDDITESIIELCEILQNYTLALCQAVAYIREQKRINAKGNSFGIREYLKHYKCAVDSREGVLDHNLEYEYRSTTLQTWNVTTSLIGQLRFGDVALKLLRVLSYLDPDAIKFRFLLEIFKPFEDSERIIETGLSLLQTYSLVKSIGEDVISIHRLVQEVTRINSGMEVVSLDLGLLLSDQGVGHMITTSGSELWKLASGNWQQMAEIWHNVVTTHGELCVTDDNKGKEFITKIWEIGSDICYYFVKDENIMFHSLKIFNTTFSTFSHLSIIRTATALSKVCQNGQNTDYIAIFESVWEGCVHAGLIEPMSRLNLGTDFADIDTDEVLFLVAKLTENLAEKSFYSDKNASLYWRRREISVLKQWVTNDIVALINCGEKLVDTLIKVVGNTEELLAVLTDVLEWRTQSYHEYDAGTLRIKLKLLNCQYALGQEKAREMIDIASVVYKTIDHMKDRLFTGGAMMSEMLVLIEIMCSLNSDENIFIFNTFIVGNEHVRSKVSEVLDIFGKVTTSVVMKTALERSALRLAWCRGK